MGHAGGRGIAEGKGRGIEPTQSMIQRNRCSSGCVVLGNS